VEVNHVYISKVKVADRDHWIDAPENAARRDSDYADTPSLEALLLVRGHIGAPNGHSVTPTNQLTANLLDVLVPSTDVRPVPYMDQKHVKTVRRMRFHQGPTPPPV
jgi:hypothetical protein